MDRLATISINVDPIALQLGPIAIHWYGVAYVVAFVAGFRWGVLPHLLPRGVSRAECDRMLTWVIVAGLVAARLYYDVQQPLGQYLHHPLEIVAVWRGGMDAFGAIFGSLAMIAFLCRRQHLNFWLIVDAGALFGVIGQPFGRIGNIINGDILGSQSSLPWATAYTNSHAVLQEGFHLGVPYQPAGAYEGLCAVAIGIVLVVLRRRGVRNGVLGLTYVGTYAVSQFAIFYLRASEPVVGLGLKQSQWTCLVMLVVGMPILYLLWRRSPGGGAAPLREEGAAETVTAGGAPAALGGVAQAETVPAGAGGVHVGGDPPEERSA